MIITQTDRQTDIQTDRQTDRRTDRQVNRQTDKSYLLQSNHHFVDTLLIVEW